MRSPALLAFVTRSWWQVELSHQADALWADGDVKYMYLRRRQIDFLDVLLRLC